MALNRSPGVGNDEAELPARSDQLQRPCHEQTISILGLWAIDLATGNKTSFLDLSSQLVGLGIFGPGSFDERGLLGVAFHPNYATNGRLFIRYSAPRAGSPDEPCSNPEAFVTGCHTAVLAEYAVSTDNANRGDIDSEVILFEIGEPQFNHNSGQVAFGPDGFLYFTLGDGGGAHDGLADTPPSHGAIGNGQNTETVLGAVLRIDVDGELPYEVPPDNPFVNTPDVNEIYAYGFRNPYRFSFDDGPGGDGRLFVADVGQNLFEEIDIVENGGNYGWVIKEGFHCFDPFDPTNPPVDCDSEGLIDPVAEYTHDDGLAVIGGFVYRGNNFPELVGKYVFGDFSMDFGPTGRLFYLDADGKLSDIFEFQLGGNNDPLGLFLFGFGEDEDGEIYAMTSENLAPVGNTGQVFRIVSGMPSVLLPQELEIVRGVQRSGELADVFTSDDSYLVLQPGITQDSSEPPIWLTLTGSSTTAAPAELRFTLESSVNTPGVTQRIGLFNYETQQFEEIDARVGTSSDSVTEIIVEGDPSRFVDSKTLAVKVRLTFMPGPLLIFPWDARIDQAVWTIIP
ncbi:MAG: PQQ-dependent sugar dehydrogenase [Planctomycetes bacterium]|nr:PQQ-dependent sugar dehydrogenase [Planctomycetota bacterium]